VLDQALLTKKGSLLVLLSGRHDHRLDMGVIYDDVVAHKFGDPIDDKADTVWGSPFLHPELR